MKLKFLLYWFVLACSRKFVQITKELKSPMKVDALYLETPAFFFKHRNPWLPGEGPDIQQGSRGVLALSAAAQPWWVFDSESVRLKPPIYLKHMSQMGRKSYTKNSSYSKAWTPKKGWKHSPSIWSSRVSMWQYLESTKFSSSPYSEFRLKTISCINCMPTSPEAPTPHATHVFWAASSGCNNGKKLL